MARIKSKPLSLKKFNHNGIIYEFKWAKKHAVSSLMPNSIKEKIDCFFNLVMRNKIAADLFDDPKTKRCSNFRIKGLKRGAQTIISNKLVDNNLVRQIDWQQEKREDISDWIYQLLNITSECFNEFNESNLKGRKPSHDYVLTKILLNLNNALSIETPIWLRKQKLITDFMNVDDNYFHFSYSSSITGHIDLLLYDNVFNCLIVADYKPEGYYLRSLPQVAFYGLILRRILQIENIKCVSFSKEKLWVYKPEILKTINKEIKNHGDPKLFWRKIIGSI